MFPSIMFRTILSSAMRLGLVMVVLALILALIDSLFLNSSDKQLCDQSTLPEGVLCVETLQREWENRVVWIDTRHDNDYTTNHLIFPDRRMFRIQSGVKMQGQLDAALTRLIEAQEKNECILVFCKKGCDSADYIAQKLRETELIDAPIYVLSDGWDALLEAGIASQ